MSDAVRLGPRQREVLARPEPIYSWSAPEKILNRLLALGLIEERIKWEPAWKRHVIHQGHYYRTDAGRAALKGGALSSLPLPADLIKEAAGHD